MVIKHKSILILDAGHGGSDRGKDKDHEEEMNLSLQCRILQMIINLELNKKFNIFLTRYNDTFIPLQERCDIANRFAKIYSTGLFLSIHHNWSVYPSANGFEAHYFKGSNIGEMFADIFHRQWENALLNTRSWKGSTFKVLRGTIFPSILLEVGFMSNKIENLKIQDQHFQDIYSLLICNAVNEIFDILQRGNEK